MAKLYKYIIGIGVAAIVIFLVWYFFNIVAYILISAVFALIGKPLVDALLKIRIGRFHLSKGWAAGVALILMCGAVVGFFYIFIPLVFTNINALSQVDLHRIEEALRAPLWSLQETIDRIFGTTESDFSVTRSVIDRLSSFLNMDYIGNILSSILSITVELFIAVFSIIFITFFFLKENNLFNSMVIGVFPSKYEANVTRAMKSITGLLVGYFTGLMIESLMLLITIAATLICFGLPVSTAFFMGLIVGILNVIPYIGPLIAAVICILIGTVTPVAGISAGGMVLIIGGTILVLKTLDMFILQPLLFSAKAKAHPLEIFLVILVAGSVAGIWGMLLAIPAYNVIRVFAKEFFNNFKLVQKLTENI